MPLHRGNELGGSEQRMETLVAIDWDGNAAGLQRLRDALGVGPEAVTAGTTPHYRTGELLLTYRVTFDPARIRATVAHGRAVDLGYVAHVE